MSKQYPECPLYNHANCREIDNRSLFTNADHYWQIDKDGLNCLKLRVYMKDGG